MLSLALFKSMPVRVEANEHVGDSGGVIVETLDMGEPLESVMFRPE